MTATLTPPTEAPAVPRRLSQRAGPADRVFRGVARSAGMTVLVMMLLVGGFLLVRGREALNVAGWSFFTTEEWAPEGGRFGIAAVLTGTLLIAAVAIVIAVPLSVGAALYISEYAPTRIKRLLVNLVDLMAAVPSVVYGLWGAFLMEGSVLGVARWIATWFGYGPFAVDGVDPSDPLASETVYTRSTLLAGLVVAMMVTPIASSVMREVFSQAPAGEREGAYALGATRWGMIRAVVLPYGKGGMIGGTMLGLGRALGETIGVVMTISLVYQIQPQILRAGASSISALIANRYGDASPFAVSALMAAGLTLFLLTLVVNFAASSIIARSRSGAEGDA